MSVLSVAKKEHNYLRSSGFLSLGVGLWFITDSVRVVLFEQYQFSSGIELGLNILEGILLLFVLFILFKNINVFNAVPASTAWLGKFEDEFLNHINMKGYQYAFNAALLILFVGILAGEIWSEETAKLGVALVCKSILAISLVAYSLPVLRALHGEQG